MKTFLDSSALAKRYIDEKGSERVEEVLGETDSLGLSVLSIPELVSAFCRKKREGDLTGDQYRLAKQSLLTDTADADIINLVPAVISRTILLLEKEPLRALDALHVGSALEWKADLFVTADRQQGDAASHSGLKVEVV